MAMVGWLMDTLNEETESNRKYYKELRREYDMRVSELKKDNEILNDILGGYLHK
jgi:hypothetical protein